MTSASFARLSEKGQWDVKVALRGPDSSYGETLKWFTAAVIRGGMMNVCRVGGLVNDDLQLVILPSGEMTAGQRAEFKSAGPAAWNYGHFCEHIDTAARWMDIPILKIEAAVWHEVMRLQSAKEAGGRIAEAGEKFLAKYAPEGEEQLSEGKLEKLYKLGISRPASFYQKAGMAELARHLAGGVRF